MTSLSNYDLATESATHEAVASARSVERDIHDPLGSGLTTARILAHTLMVQLDPSLPTQLSRDQVNAIIRQVVLNSPHVLGSCTQWEPNAFDGLDADFAGTAMHDETGRFIPYWYRNKAGEVTGEPLHDYAEANWWVKPKKLKAECIIEPYFYELEGQDVFLMTFSVPIMPDGQFMGIATVDISIDFIQDLVDQVDVFGGEATIAVIGGNNRLLAVNGQPELRQNSVTDLLPDFKEFQEMAIGDGMAVYESAGFLQVITPIWFGEVATPWFVSVGIPMTNVMAAPKRALDQDVLLGISSTVIGLLLLWVLVGRLTRPLGQAAEQAHMIGSGDLSRRLNLDTDDEIGQLGSALDSMANALQQRTSELEESQRNLAITLDSIGDAVIVTDDKGCVVRMNPIAQELTGFALAEARNMPLAEVLRLISSDTGQPLASPVDEVLETGTIVTLPADATLVSNNGDQYQISDSAAPIFNADDDLVGAVLVFRDVTGQNILEKRLRQSQKMEAVGQLAGGIAHDFNNMLSGILGSAELLLLDDDNNQETIHSIETILDAANRASGLTRKLLDFSRKGEAVSTLINTHKVIQEAISILSRSIDRSIELKVDLGAEFSNIIGDPVQVQGLVLNLGVNARDAMPDGGILTVATQQVMLDPEFCRFSTSEIEPGHYLEVHIKDTGQGMDEETQKRIFEPFFTTKEVGKGTGLGLSSVYGSIQDLKGAIHCYSELGVGTLFRVYLPLAPEDMAEIIVDEQEVVFGQGNILMVDDELVVRNMGNAMLSSLGYTATMAEHGEHALEIFREDPTAFDLVILDIVMPRMGGEETFHMLRKINPEVKVIFSSGFTRNTSIDDLLAAGASDFIFKPFGRAALSAKIAQALGSVT